MSNADFYRGWLGDHHQALDDPDGTIHVFSQADIPDASILWFFNIFWNLFGIRWGGDINLKTLYIDALFSVYLPILIWIPPIAVKGSLLGNGVNVSLAPFYFVEGWARFYEQDWQGDQYLYVQIFVEKLFGRPINKTKTLRLRKIPKVKEAE
ncbi:hypothetical protein BJV74DRAFT_115131 [Russula compacta]|nr:hypothetical protein BJV74DRAFT_115131 [Russula compacta]